MGGSGAGLGNAAKGGATHDFLQQPDAFNQLVQIHPGCDAHAVKHVHEIFGRHHATSPAIAAILPAADAAQGAFDNRGVMPVKRAQCGVD